MHPGRVLGRVDIGDHTQGVAHDEGQPRPAGRQPPGPPGEDPLGAEPAGRRDEAARLPIGIGPAPADGLLMLRAADAWTELADNDGTLSITIRRGEAP